MSVGKLIGAYLEEPQRAGKLVFFGNCSSSTGFLSIQDRGPSGRPCVCLVRGRRCGDCHNFELRSGCFPTLIMSSNLAPLVY
jgi:hypothetical protein